MLFCIRLTIVCFLVVIESSSQFSQKKILLDSTDYISLLNFQKIDEMIQNGDYSAAMHILKAAIKHRAFQGKPECELSIHTKLGLVYWNLGMMKNSVECNKKSLKLCNFLNLSIQRDRLRDVQKIHDLYFLGKKHREMKNYEESILCFQNALKLAKTIASPAHLLKLNRQLSLTYWEVSDFNQFYLLNHQGLELAKKLNHKLETCRAMNNLGMFYIIRNKLSKSLFLFISSLRTARSIGAIDEVSGSLNNIAITYSTMGYYDKSLEYLFEALKLDKKSNNLISLSKDYNNIGFAYCKKAVSENNDKYYARAIEYYKMCLDLANTFNDTETIVRVINNIGNLHLELKNYLTALHYFHSNLDRIPSGSFIETVGMVYTNIGRAYFQIKKYDLSQRYYNLAISTSSKIKRNEILWEAIFGLAQIQEKLGFNKTAADLYVKSVELIDNVRSNLILDVNKAGFVRDKFVVYESLIRVLNKLHIANPHCGYDREMYLFTEKSKARAFYESLSEAHVDFETNLAPDLKKRIKNLKYNIRLYYEKLLPLENNGIQKKIRLKLEQAEDEYLALNAKIRMDNQDYYQLIASDSIRVEDAQKFIQKNQAIFEYSIGQTISFLYVITKEKFNVFELPGRVNINRSLRAYLKLISDEPDGPFMGEHASYRLFLEFFAKGIESISEDIECIFIIPDGMLNYLPFEALVCNEPSQGHSNHMLIHKYEISYIPSTLSLITIHNREQVDSLPMDFLAFGDPDYLNDSRQKNFNNSGNLLKKMYIKQGFNIASLPFSLDEIMILSRYFDAEKSRYFIKAKAKESVVKQTDLTLYRIIHFACHGLIDENAPYRSALVLSLSDNNQEDGFLQVNEIYNLRMKADLVVLSACQTGRGLIEKGEGVLGLSRVFFYSGANSVLSTLWKIKDKSTALFMEKFYKYLIKGSRKSEALRKAKLEFIETKNKHPYFWAPFVLNGNSSAIQFNIRNSTNLN